MMVSRKKTTGSSKIEFVGPLELTPDTLIQQALSKSIKQEPDFVELKGFNIFRVDMRLDDGDWELKYQNANQFQTKKIFDELFDQYATKGYEIRLVQCYESIRQKKGEGAMSRTRVSGEVVLYTTVSGDKDKILFEKEDPIV
jgi:hypothetical protein